MTLLMIYKHAGQLVCGNVKRERNRFEDKGLQSIAVLLSVLLFFLHHGFQCDKTPHLVHGEAFEVQNEIYRRDFRRGALNARRIY